MRKANPEALRWRMLLASATLLLIYFSRVRLLNTLEFNPDEVWNAWSTVGSLGDVLARVPYDWPPLHFVLIWLWQGLVGDHPLVLRMLSVLTYMLALAFTYRAAYKLSGRSLVAWGALLAFAGLGYSVFLSVYFRAYVLMLLWLPLLLWLALRYLERATLRRALPVALVMAAMFYTNLTAVVAFGVVGIVTLILHTRRIWRWWLPGLIAFGLAIPEILSKAALLGRRTTYNDALLPLPAALVQIYSDYMGTAFIPWLLALVVAIGLILLRERPSKRNTSALLIWVLLLPCAMYVLDPLLAFFSAQYSWWGLTGIALLIGVGFAYLPRLGRVVAGGLALGAMFLPLEVENAFGSPPFEATFRDLSGYVQAGDIFVLDPLCNCGQPIEWDYYQRVYLPQRLYITADAARSAAARRVWYVQNISRYDEALAQTVTSSRLAGNFVGPWDFFFRVYEAPPDAVGSTYANGLRFHGVDVLDARREHDLRPIVRREGDTLRLRLWWSLAEDADIGRDYSVATHLLDSAGAVVAQFDGLPQTVNLHPLDDAPTPQETSGWQAGRLYIEERTLALPNPLPQGDYTLALIVYQWWDGQRIASDATTANDTLPLATVHIMSW